MRPCIQAHLEWNKYSFAAFDSLQEVKRIAGPILPSSQIVCFWTALTFGDRG